MCVCVCVCVCVYERERERERERDHVTLAGISTACVYSDGIPLCGYFELIYVDVSCGYSRSWQC